MTTIRCNVCGAHASPLAWRCCRPATAKGSDALAQNSYPIRRTSDAVCANRSCGGSLDLVGLPAFEPERIHAADASMWRYAAMLPAPKRVSLGEGMTPLRPVELDGDRIFAKLEYLNPTGSFKDRGTATMINYLAGLGAREVLDNSSGNAGASIAAYASLAGMRARIFVPAATASASKKNLIRLFGGAIVESRQPIADVESAAQCTPYASHAWSPWFALGQMTVAWETWEQMGRRAPDAVATPVGHGGLFLGYYRGYRALQAASLIEAMPRMIAVQSSGVDPIARAWEQQLESPPPVSARESVADGILVETPARGRQILDALYQSDGFALRVDNEAIRAARLRMFRKGLTIEMTSAVVAAALPQIRRRLGRRASLVLAFTGNGLKDLA